MAAKNRSKQQRPQVLNVVKNAGRIRKEIVDAAVGMIEAGRAAQEREAAQAKAYAAKERAGVHLTATQAKQAAFMLSDVNSNLISCVQIAQMAMDTGTTDAALSAIEALAKIGCRKLDAVARTLGDGGFGNYEMELSGTVESLAFRD